MSVPDEQLAELLAIFTTVENGAVEAGAVSFADAVEGALPAVLDRYRRMIADEIRTVWPDTLGMWDVNQHMAARTTKEQILKRVTRGES